MTGWGSPTNVTFHIMRRSEIPDMASSGIPDTAGKNTRRRIQAIANRHAFHANSIKQTEPDKHLQPFTQFHLERNKIAKPHTLFFKIIVLDKNNVLNVILDNNR